MVILREGHDLLNGKGGIHHSMQVEIGVRISAQKYKIESVIFTTQQKDNFQAHLME